ncbi:MAG: hypothetical protein HRT98_02845 [Mycoplasmatales bacterium]|nr:hypothetical protein [Mycoplasmatales bacterium]
MKYNQKHKQKVVNYSKNHGVIKASKKYGIPKSTIYKWRREMNTLTPKHLDISSVKNRDYAKLTDEELRCLFFIKLKSKSLIKKILRDENEKDI